MRTVGAAARPGWLDAAEVAAANHRSSWISTPLPEQGGRPSQVCKSYADDRALTPVMSFCPSLTASITPPPSLMSIMSISSERSAYLMKRPRFRLRAICSGVPCSVMPQPSEKALLELAAREVGVSLTN